MMAEQAAKAAGSMSAELLKKAAELRAGQLSAEDIKSLQRTAEFLAQDLAKLAESKEFQAMVEQLARQVTPEQMEKVARELMRNEQLRRELEASAKMLMQNQQVREVVAGLARKFGNRPNQPREGQPGPQNADGRNGQPAENNGQGRGAGGQGDGQGAAQPPAQGKLAGQGKDAKASGNLQRKDGGEYLYLQTKAEAGAARAPYSSAYPQYRREAERSIQRSQVPPHMRSVVRRYFDAINPDRKKQP